jgi:hypothetical protein
MSSKQRIAAIDLVWILLPLQLIYVFYVYSYLQSYGGLPAPFFHDASDTFMDFFTTNYWAFNDGRYDDWKSIYPIFVFALSKLFTSTSCTVELISPSELRTCDIGSLFYLVAAYLIGAASCARLLVARFPGTWRARWRKGVACFIVIALSVPGLFALERGNYIVIAFLFLALAECFEGHWLSALFLALAINIKQYLMILWIAPFLKRRYDLLLIGVVFAIIPNILGLIFVPELHYAQFVDNMFQFASTDSFSPFQQVWMPTSLAAWVRTVESPKVSFILEGGYFEWVQAFLIAALWAARGLFIAALYLAATRSRAISPAYISFICITGLVAGIDGLGGYSVLLMFPFLNSLATRPYGRVMTALVILICLPLGFHVGPELLRGSVSFLTGQLVSVPAELSLGSYLRPVLLLILLAVIVLDLLASRYTKLVRRTVAVDIENTDIDGTVLSRSLHGPVETRRLKPIEEHTR